MEISPNSCSFLVKTITELSNLPPNICPTYYLFAVKNLFNDIKNAQKNSIQEKRNIFENFTNKFTTVPDIWVEWRDIEKESINDLHSFLQNKQIFKTLKDKSIKHFQMGYDFENDVISDVTFDEYTVKSIKYEFAEIKNFKNILKNVKEINIIFESWNIFDYAIREIKKNKDFGAFWKICQEHSTMEISKDVKRKVEEYILVEEQLCGIKDDVKWMEILVKKGSKECIIQFFENRIYNNPFNTVIWKFYINYLNKEKNIAVLDVFSRYCRLFIDDISMRNQYFETTIKFHKIDKNVSKWMLDIIKIEADFVSINSSINLIVKILEEIYYSKIEFHKNVDLCFNDIFAIFKQKINFINDKIEQQKQKMYQTFPFPLTMISGILNSEKASQIQKLRKCCKYFCNKIKATVIHKLSFTKIQQTFMHQNSIFINIENLEQFKMEKIWLTNSLTIGSCADYDTKLSLSKFLIPKLYQCNIRFLNITNQYLTGKEFDFLTKSKNIESLTLYGTSIKDSDGTEYCLEKIIQQCPNGYKFRIQWIPCNSKTAKILSSLNHRAKITYFNYKNATEEFDYDEFSNFVMKNGTPSSFFTITFFRNHPL